MFYMWIGVHGWFWAGPLPAFCQARTFEIFFIEVVSCSFVSLKLPGASCMSSQIMGKVACFLVQ